MKKTTIFITDDHKIVVEGIKSFLVGYDDLEFIGSAQNSSQLFAFLKQKQPDILLLDIKLSGLSGIQIAQIVKREYPSIKIVSLSTFTDKETIDNAIQAGSCAYLSKDVEEDEFVKAMHIIIAGGNYFSSDIQQTVFCAYAEKTNSQYTSQNQLLSAREIEVIKLFSEGLSYGDIADRLFISKRTVETHKKNIMDKLDLKTNVDLIKYCIVNGLDSF